MSRGPALAEFLHARLDDTTRWAHDVLSWILTEQGQAAIDHARTAGGLSLVTVADDLLLLAAERRRVVRRYEEAERRSAAARRHCPIPGDPHAPPHTDGEDPDRLELRGLEWTCRQLAAAYRAHPDYREHDWAP
ncbi:hypothetical protein BJF78_04315 [Pseudonocardia sp. CNS-139]|nr:hypothetical protein BJF78_04315 [Pseudonocardia sp. CNS-139]